MKDAVQTLFAHFNAATTIEAMNGTIVYII
jgi:hypothetical protein